MTLLPWISKSQRDTVCQNSIFLFYFFFFKKGSPKSQQSCINLCKSELIESLHHLCVNSFLAVLESPPAVELKR